MTKKILILIFTLLTIGIAVIFCFRSRLVYQLVVRERALSSDAIVVLLGGTANERIEQAANLYEQDLAPKIVLCNGYVIGGAKAWWYKKSGWIPLGKNFRFHLKSRGIPDSAIHIVDCPGIHDTASEIKALETYLLATGNSSVIVSTSASHSRRASLVWRRVAPSIAATMVAARDPGLQHWWSTRRGRTIVIYEYLALAKELTRLHSDNFNRLLQKLLHI